MTCDEILNRLNPEQAEAARTINGPVLVLAGAGTGKTRVITYRIAYMLAAGIPPAAILGLTFTNKAAREMKERLASLVAPELAQNVTLGTFHNFALRVLRQECRRLGYLPGFTIADEADQTGLIKQAVGELGYSKEDFPVSEAQSVISRWKNRLLTADEARAAAHTDFEAAAARIYAKYQELLELQNAVDFDDMLLLLYQLFHHFPEVLERYRERYCYLLIDEYQDTNAAQFTLVKMLAGSRANLCVVGDDDQSIYSWRGAEIENILNFPQYFPGTKVIKLEQNYRSTSAILTAANAAIGANPNRHQKKLWSKLGEGELPVIVRLDNAEAEADFVANMIVQEMAEHPERKYADFAVLYRSNHLSRQLEQSFRKTGVPYRLVGGQEFFQRREIRDAAAYLKLLVNPRDDQSLLRILGTPPRGLADKAVQLLKAGRARQTPMCETLLEEGFLSSLPPKASAAARALGSCLKSYRASAALPGGVTALARDFLNDVGYVPGLQRIYKDIEDASKRRENVDEFLNAIASFEQRAEGPVTLEAFLESFALLEENDKVADQSEDGDAVTFSTIHAAKGLEFPVVFSIAVERGLFPHERAVEEGSTDEELRLFYVDVTRAKEKLFLTYTRERMQRGFTKPAIASSFLTLLNEKVALRCRPEELYHEATKEEMDDAFARIFALLDEDDGGKGVPF